MFQPVLSQRAGRSRAERRNSRPGLDFAVRWKERLTPPVFAAKAGEFNLLSLTGFACPQPSAKTGSSSISRIHGVLQCHAGLEGRCG